MVAAVTHLLQIVIVTAVVGVLMLEEYQDDLITEVQILD